MPIKTTISRDDQLVEIHVYGEVKIEEIRDCFMELIGAGAVPFRKIVDLAFAPLTHGGAGIKAVSERTREVARTLPLGPVAVVVASELAEDIVAEFNRQGSLNRPLKVFRDARAARDWVMAQAPGEMPAS